MHKAIKTAKLIGILAVTGAIVFFARSALINFMYAAPYFNLREINISGDGYVTKDKILILSHFSHGDNIFNLDIAGAARNINAHPLIKEAVVIRRLPDAVDINVKERNQVAYIELGLKKYGLDDEGVILPIYAIASLPGVAKQSNLPLVTGLRFSRAVVGEKLDLAGVKSALNVLENIKETRLDEYIEVSEINVVKPAHPVLFIARDKTEIRLGNFPLRSQFDSLKLILVDLRDKGAAAEYIDLRFGEKIVVKERKG